MVEGRDYSLGSYFEPGGKASSNVYELSEQLMRTHKFYSPSANSGRDVWIYDPSIGIWTPTGENLVRKFVREALANFFTNHLVNEIVSYINAAAYQPDINIGGSETKIVCENGVLNTFTGEFTKTFDPDEYHIVRLPVSYDPDADCPEFEKFLGQVTRSENDRLAIGEFIGYCLYKTYTFEIIMLLVGEGANGKSILLSVIKSFLGSKNVSSVTPQQLERSRFASSQLHGRLACIAGDIPSQPLKYTGLLKMLTGGDLIHAEYKNRDPFDFVNHAKLIFSANQVPESWDSSIAFYRRFRIIEFPNSFSPEDKNFIPRDVLLARLLSEKEKSGILNLALNGLRRLREQGQLSGESTMQEKRLDYIYRSDPVHYFFEKYVSHDPGAAVIAKSVLYDIYIKFCHMEGKIPISDSYFAKKVKQLAPYVGESRLREGDQRIAVWTGLGLNYEAYDKDITLGRGGRGGRGKKTIPANPAEQEELSTEAVLEKTPDHPDHPDHETEKFTLSMKEYNDWGAEALRRGEIRKVGTSDYVRLKEKEVQS